MIPERHNQLLLHLQDGPHRFGADDVIYLEARSNYTCFHFTQRPKLLVAKTLKDCLATLPLNNFCRVHHSYVVNRSHVLQIDANVLCLTNRIQIQISRRRKKIVLTALA